MASYVLTMGEKMTNNNNKNNNTAGEESKDLVGILIHSQVRKIKQEDEKINDTSPLQPEIRYVYRDIRRQLSRSPLGRRAGRAISVGDS